MSTHSTDRVIIELVSFPEVLDGQKVVGMKLGDEDYVMLLVKSSVLIYPLVTQTLPNYFAVEAITGMAFDYNASLEQGLLVTHPDSRAIGLYVKATDFDKVRDFFNK